MLKRILALDLGKDKTAARLHCSDGRRDFTASIRTTRQELHDLIVSTDPTVVIIEACPVTWWVYDLATELGAEVIVTANNGPGWKWRHVRNKSDRSDAAKIIKMYLSDQLEPVWVPDHEGRQWRGLIKHRHNLVNDSKRHRNRILSLFTTQGVDLPDRSAWTQDWLNGVRAHARALADCHPEELWRGRLADLLEQYEQVERLIGQTEQVLEQIAERHEAVEVVRSPKGVGPCLSQALVAVIGDPLRFKSGKQVACYVGLTPRHWSSGTIERSGGISKQGSSLLRSLLVEVSWLGLRHQPWMQEVYDRVKRGVKERSKIAIVAVARRLLIRLWAMWRDAERERLGVISPAVQ